VRVPAEDLGRKAADLLFDLVDGNVAHPRHTVLPTELILRDSCGPHSD
jgi:DNA-binding LacI/PurR family transcriptional regulator